MVRAFLTLLPTILAGCCQPQPTPQPVRIVVAHEFLRCQMPAPLPSTPPTPRTFDSIIRWAKSMEAAADKRGAALLECDRRREHLAGMLDEKRQVVPPP